MRTYGLRFVKMDLQVHTPASLCFLDKSVRPEHIVRKALEVGLKAIAVTDHNTGEWIDRVKAAANKSPLTVLPGVELTVGDAHIHLVALLDVDVGTAEIQAMLSRLGVMPADFGKRETFIDKSVNEVIDIVTGEFHGLCFLAHVDSSSGVFKEMRGQPRIEIIQNPNLLAVEVVDLSEVAKFLDGTDPDYKRKLTVIQSSDNPTLDKEGKRITSGENAGKHSLDGIGYRFAYFKVDEKPTIESLRQCFVDPDVRIRWMTDFKELRYPHIKSMKMTGGFLDGASLEFHPGLNSILGGKGVGKSLVVEFARFALNQESTQPEILGDYESKLLHRLEQYGTVELEFCDETGKVTKIKRTYNESEEHPFDGEAKGTYVAQLFPVLFISQNEIIKIAENPEQQLQFIDRFFDFHTMREKIARLEEELSQLDRDFAHRLRAVHKKSELEKKKNTIDKEIEKLNKQLANPVFKSFSGYEDKNRFLLRQYEFLKGIIDSVSKQLSFEKFITPAIPANLRDDPQLKRINDIIVEAISTAKKDFVTLIGNLKGSLQQIASEHDKFKPIFEAEKNKYEETVRNSGGDVKSLETARKKQLSLMDEVLKQVSDIESLANELSGLNDLRDKKLQEYFNVHNEYYRIRKEKSRKIEQDCDDKIKIEIEAATNRDEFRKKLQQMKVGSYLTSEEIKQIVERMDPTEFIKSVLRYDLSEKEQHIEAISQAVGIDKSRILRLVSFLLDNLEYEELLALQYQVQPQDRPFISLKVGEDKYETIDKLSVGQKCVAMLMIALSEGTMPIVIDQPEDSLDIRSIWEDMCIRIREGKEKRQFIFTTHNSSIAVASDTDKFTIVEADAYRGKVVFQGSLDNKAIKDEVIKYLEGGKKTYSRKFYKYYTRTKDIEGV